MSSIKFTFHTIYWNLYRQVKLIAEEFKKISFIKHSFTAPSAAAATTGQGSQGTTKLDAVHYWRPREFGTLHRLWEGLHFARSPRRRRLVALLCPGLWERLQNDPGGPRYRLEPRGTSTHRISSLLKFFSAGNGIWFNSYQNVRIIESKWLSVGYLSDWHP